MEYLVVGSVVGALTSAIWFKTSKEKEFFFRILIGLTIGALSIIVWPALIPGAIGYVLYLGDEL